MKKDDTKAWMMTYTGKQVYPLEMKPEDICINDIAHSLGLQCRFNGMVSDFYSVAEHCVLISEWLEQEGYDEDTQLSGLLHDANEAYLSDMIRPIKNALGDAYEPFKAAGSKIDVLLADMHKLEYPWSHAVHDADSRIINDEKTYLFGTGKPWVHGGDPLGVDIKCWEPREAERRYRFRYYKLWTPVNDGPSNVQPDPDVATPKSIQAEEPLWIRWRR